MRVDVLVCSSRGAVDEMASQVLESMMMPVVATATQRVLPTSHALVRQRLSSQRRPADSGLAGRPTAKRPNWIAEHAAFRWSHAIVKAGGVSPVQLLPGARARDAWG